jgi:threonine dehydrogenase-like Zn-dependent dehydrogenase
MKVLAGDWKVDGPVIVVKNSRGQLKELHLPVGVWKSDKMKPQDIASFEIVTEENKASVMGKLGWGAVGAIALGPLGLLAGVLAGGNRRDRVMVLTFKDSRRAMLKGNAKDAEMLQAAAFNGPGGA